MPSNTQGVESAIKDVAYVGSTGREEKMVSIIACVRSTFTPVVTKLVQHDPDFLSRKRKNNKSKDYLSGKIFNKNMLKHTFSFYADQHSDSEINHCKKLLSKEEYYRAKRFQDVMMKYVTNNQGEPDKPLNVRQLTSGINFAPMLLGK